MSNTAMHVVLEGYWISRIGAWKRGVLGASQQDSWRKSFGGSLEIQRRHTDLPQIVRAAHPPGRFAGRLDGRQEQPDEHADDRDDHQQLD